MVIHGHIQKFTSYDLTYFLYNTTKILKNLDCLKVSLKKIVPETGAKPRSSPEHPR